MDRDDINTTYALYLFAGIFFIISIIYFGAEVIFQLSPVTKSLLLLSLTDLIVLTGIYTSGRIKSILSYLTGFISYLIFVAYTLGIFNPSTELTLAFLLLSAAAFAALGKLIDGGKLVITSRRYKGIIALIVVASAGITAADMVGPQVEYPVELEENVEIQEGSNEVGQMQAVNDYYLMRSYEVPDYEACAFDPERRDVRVDIGDYDTDSGNLDGGGSKTFNVTVDARAMPRTEIEVPSDRQPIRGEFAVETAEGCPSNGENRTIYLFEDNDDRRFD